MPISPLVRMLNNPDVRTNADLHVLGGDLARAPVIFGRLKTLATDLYYRDDHDIVVNTAGDARRHGAHAADHLLIDTGNQVTHFHYFRRSGHGGPPACRRLTGSDTEFRTLPVRPSAVTSASYQKRATISKPVVIVLPGIMGSELTVDGSPVLDEDRRTCARRPDALVGRGRASRPSADCCPTATRRCANT